MKLALQRALLRLDLQNQRSGFIALWNGTTANGHTQGREPRDARIVVVFLDPKRGVDGHDGDFLKLRTDNAKNTPIRRIVT